jgi:hypothetical protein
VSLHLYPVHAIASLPHASPSCANGKHTPSSYTPAPFMHCRQYSCSLHGEDRHGVCVVVVDDDVVGVVVVVVDGQLSGVTHVGVDACMDNNT